MNKIIRVKDNANNILKQLIIMAQDHDLCTKFLESYLDWKNLIYYVDTQIRARYGIDCPIKFGCNGYEKGNATPEQLNQLPKSIAQYHVEFDIWQFHELNMAWATEFEHISKDVLARIQLVLEDKINKHYSHQ